MRKRALPKKRIVTPSYIRVVKAFPGCVGDGAGEDIERPVKSKGH